MANISQKQIVDFLKTIQGQQIHIDSIMKEFQIDPQYRAQLRAILSRCYKEKIAKPSGAKDGWIKVLRKVEPVRWWEANESAYFDLSFPYGHEDNSKFGFEKLFKISPGDLIVIGGVSNFGKTAMALNILGENIDKAPCMLMGNEYTTLDGMPSPKFKRRMKRMTWAEWMDGNNQPKFELLPVREDFEDYIQSNKINIMDWINLEGGKLYDIGKVFERIKEATGQGIAVAVLMKEEDAPLARGRGFTKDLADVYIVIDPYGEGESRLQLIKVKEPIGKVYNRHWAFSLVDGGANFHNIREIKRCSGCYGKGYTKQGKCSICWGKGYIELEEEFLNE